MFRLCGPQQYKNTKNLLKYKNQKLIYIYIYIKKKQQQIQVLLNERVFIFPEFPETCFLLVLVQNEGWEGLHRIEETKLVCAI